MSSTARNAEVGARPLPGGTDLPVLMPAADRLARRVARERLAGIRCASCEPRHAWFLLLAFICAAGYAQAQAGPAKPSIIDTIWKWTPLLAKGFAFNIAISALAMAIGTAFGVFLGLAQISRAAPVASARGSSPISSATRRGWCCCSTACSCCRSSSRCSA